MLNVGSAAIFKFYVRFLDEPLWNVSSFKSIYLFSPQKRVTPIFRFTRVSDHHFPIYFFVNIQSSLMIFMCIFPGQEIPLQINMLYYKMV